MNWRLVLYLAGLIVLIFYTVLTVRIKTDISAFIISGDSAEEILLASEMQSGTLSRRYILSVGSLEKNPIPTGFVSEFIDRLADLPGVVDVWRPGNNRLTADAIQSAYEGYGANLYSLSAESELDFLLSAEGLDQRAEMLRQALLSPQGNRVKQIARNDPLLLILNGFKSVKKQRVPGTIDAGYQILILQTGESGLNVPEQKRIQQAITGVFDKLNPGTWVLEMTGVPVFAAATQSLIQNDITRVSLLSSAAISLLFLIVFRSFLSLIRVVLLLVAVFSTAVLVTQFVFGSVHGMTLAIGTTMIGVCIDYPIHALVHGQSVFPQQRRKLISKIWSSMLMGGLTTLIGYTALGFSGYPGFQQIAVYAGTGILVSLLLTRFVLPSMMGSTPLPKVKIPGVNHWIEFCARNSRLIFGLMGIFLIGSIFQLGQLNWIDDLQKLTPEMARLKARDKAIRSRMVTIEPGRFILVTGKDTESALLKAEEIYSILDDLKRTGDLNAYFGLYPWLLSSELQQKNHRMLNERLNSKVIEDWKIALQKHALSVSKLGNLDYSKMKLLRFSELMETPVRRLIDQQIIEHEGRTLILIWIAKHSPEKLREAFDGLENVSYFSQRDLLNNLAFGYRDRARGLLSAGVSAIFLLLLIRYRSLLKTCITLLPSVLSASIIFVLWSIFQTQVSFLHLIGFILVVAICVDYGIFYQENRAGDAITTYQAMAASMLTSALAFGCLAVADTAILKTLAGVVSLGVVLGFLLCPLFIRHVESKGHAQ